MEKLNNKVNKVLWVSRHILTSEQIAGLEKIAGDAIEVKTLNKTVTSAKEIADEAKDCKYVAVVLPVGLLAELYEILDTDQTILIPRSKRILVPSSDGTENKVVFAYDGWEVIEKVIYKSHIIK